LLIKANPISLLIKASPSLSNISGGSSSVTDPSSNSSWGSSLGSEKVSILTFSAPGTP
jgi:hypothetical protein